MATPTLKNKVSPHIQDQLPEFVKADHPIFSTFLKHYYEFLEAGELTLTGSNEYVIEETITKNYILDEDTEKIVLESSVGKFTVGETVTGSKTKATAKILVDDFDDNNRLFVTSQQLFEVGETITGSTSGATSTVVSYRANPVQNIQQLLDYADVDNTVYKFLDNFRDSLMESIPYTLAGGAEKRKLLKNIKDLYAAKGTADGHKLFFRILFDEEAEIIYPRDSLLRSSDGEWASSKIVRITESGNSDFTTAIGQILTGATSGATGIITTIIKFREGADDIAEINLDENSITGTFLEGEVVTSVDINQDLEIGGIVKGIVTGATISSRGAYYEIGDAVNFGVGGNSAAKAKVESIQPGSINEILIESGGSNYSIGDQIVYNNTGTEGVDARARVAVVGGGLSLEQSTSPDQLVMEDNTLVGIIHTDNFELEDSTTTNVYLEDNAGDNILLETGEQIILEQDAVYYASASGTTTDLSGDIILEDNNRLLREEADAFFTELETSVGDIDNLVLEDGGQIIIEPQTFTDLGVASETGEITKIEIINVGNGYLKTPLVTVSSSTGSGASIYACSTVAPRVGSVGGVSITNFGLNYTSVPDIIFNKNYIIKNYTGTFVAGDQLTSHTGVVVDFDDTRNLLKINTSVTLDEDDTITTATGATATIVQGDFATATTEIGTIGTTVGSFVSERGKVSTESMKVQDSYYYQDYSYVVRVGQSINEWRDSIRRSVHPAGWNVFGEVSFASQVSANIQVPAAGSVDDYTGDDTFTPELASLFTNLFTTIFGRRLGTKDDGTSLRSQTEFLLLETGDEILLETGDKVLYSEPSEMQEGSEVPLPPNTREVTLESSVSVRFSDHNYSGHYTGPTLDNVAKFGFAVDPIGENETHFLIMEDENHLLLEGTRGDEHHGEDEHDHFVQEWKDYSIPHYPGIHRLPTEGKNFTRDQYSIAQIGEFRINQLSEPDGSGGYRIPAAAYSTIINIPPPGEILVTRTGLTNTFDMNFTTFDMGNQTFDESGGTLDSPARYVQSFDENGLTFDGSSVKFDRAAGRDEKLFSRTSTTFDDGETRFDNQLGGKLTYDQIDISMDSNSYTLDETV